MLNKSQAQCFSTITRGQLLKVQLLPSGKLAAAEIVHGLDLHKKSKYSHVKGEVLPFQL